MKELFIIQAISSYVDECYDVHFTAKVLPRTFKSYDEARDYAWEVEASNNYADVQVVCIGRSGKVQKNGVEDLYCV